MKSILSILMVLALTHLHAEDWDVLGRTFHNVTVTQVEPDRVHVTYDYGVGTINIADMPPELRKRFTADPAAAKAAADAREKARLAVVASLPPPAPAPVAVAVTPPIAKFAAARTVSMGSINDDVFAKPVIEDPEDKKPNRSYTTGANDRAQSR